MLLGKLIFHLGFRFFLWLLTKNKLLTRDNLAKRREVLDQSYLFCSERESICHLFFDCCVAKCCRSTISELLNSREVVNFEYVAARWVAIASKKHELYNIISSAFLWCL